MNYWILCSLSVLERYLTVSANTDLVWTAGAKSLQHRWQYFSSTSTGWGEICASAFLAFKGTYDSEWLILKWLNEMGSKMWFQNTCGEVNWTFRTDSSSESNMLHFLGSPWANPGPWTHSGHSLDTQKFDFDRKWRINAKYIIISSDIRWREVLFIFGE